MIDEIKMTSEKNRYIATVKWFNSKSGYGFLSLLNHPSGDIDMFVHVTNLNTKKNVFRTLITGEYVECSVEPNDENGRDHAVDVTGVLRNSLMCETNGNKNYYRNYSSTD